MGTLIGGEFGNKHKVLVVLCLGVLLEIYLGVCFPDDFNSLGLLSAGMLGEYQLKSPDHVLLAMIYSLAIRNLDGLPVFLVSLGAAMLASTMHFSTKIESSFIIVLLGILQVESLVTVKLVNNEN